MESLAALASETDNPQFDEQLRRVTAYLQSEGIIDAGGWFIDTAENWERLAEVEERRERREP